jgi:hypothetical protein
VLCADHEIHTEYTRLEKYVKGGNDEQMKKRYTAVYLIESGLGPILNRNIAS